VPIGLNNISAGDPLSWLGRRLTDLERKVRELAAAPTLQNASISQGRDRSPQRRGNNRR